jgi:hypothetical protein
MVLVYALAAVCACVGSARGADVGANDDTGKWAGDAGIVFFSEMAALGLRQTVMSVRWQPEDDASVIDVEELDRAVAAATTAGLDVVLAVYPYPPRAIELGRASPSSFADYVGRVAERYPQVRQYVIGNEPNQPAFWRPQFSGRSGANVSASTFGTYLAAAYDVLKARDSSITVVGVASRRAGTTGLARATTSRRRPFASSPRWAAGTARAAVPLR